MSIESETAGALAVEFAKKVGDRVFARMREAGKEVSAQDAYRIATAIERIGSFGIGDRKPENEVVLAHWKAVLASYDYVTSDILADGISDAARIVAEEAAKYGLVLAKVFARSFGILVP